MSKPEVTLILKLSAADQLASVFLATGPLDDDALQGDDLELSDGVFGILSAAAPEMAHEVFDNLKLALRSAGVRVVTIAKVETEETGTEESN